MMTTKSLFLTAVAAGALTAAMPAAAQVAPAPAPAPAAAPDRGETDDAPAGDIIVTAQKRSERLQDVPVAITVVSGDALAARGAVNIEGAQYLVPTLNFRKSGTAINQSLFLRGVGTSTFSIAGEPSISTVVDGVVYSRAGEAFSDLIDIDRMEVLRGPQGTLFGKNTSAGVINIVTKRPGKDLGGYVEGGFFFDNGNEYRVRGAIDLPVSSDVALRVTGFYGTYDGNIRNLAYGGERVNGYEHYGARAMLVANLAPNFTATVIADYRESKDNCCAEVIGTTPTGAAGSAGAFAATVLPPARRDETREINQDLITRTNEKSWGVSGQFDWELGNQTVTYIGSYREYDNEEIRDGDWLPRAYSGLNQLHDVGPQVSNTITQELRLTSPADQFFSYVLGAFYSRAETTRTFTRNDIVCNAAPVGTPCSTVPALTTRPTGTAVFGSVFKNFALFGQGTLNFTDRFRGIVGIRYTTDQLDVFHRRVTTLAGPGIQPSFGPFTGKTTNDNWSGKAGVQYDIVPQSTFYATYARGYKGPAFNIFYNLTATGTNVIEPETADSYEAGLKNTLFGGKLVVNLAAYYAKYNNFQANNPDEVAGVLVTRFTNAGRISTRGGELDLLFQPVRDLSFNGGLAYTDARVDQFKLPTNGNVTGVVPSGTPLGYAPKWKGSLGADWRARTGGAVDFALGAQGSYQSSQLSQLDANAAIRAATTIKGYGLVDLSAAVIDADDRYRVTFQVKNLFDQSFAAAITSGGPGGSYRYIIPREADRYYGVTARVNF
ncbi:MULTISPECIES: TonB-dependent receptor [Sphingomonas]|uniref:TonB-dependent receptor n=1 Tax=Sphingomonas adhaesiva TaxID=28212 RepID=A0A2A4IBX9_9SPHN|nr:MULTISPECIES: TonB-dependent receptor [Sphingomonas]PCG15320.1 TonB-dependent receptor [Sphingomonas adhaesiva]PZU77535.1 MAG: TonB-dependent receptor [Sphingomonas sp.]